MERSSKTEPTGFYLYDLTLIYKKTKMPSLFRTPRPARSVMRGKLLALNANCEPAAGSRSIADTINVKEGGHLRHLFFDVGRDQLIAFLEPNGVPDVPAKYDAGINRGLGVPAGFYHFAFEAGSAAALAEKRDELRSKGVETTDIVDHGWARSIYFKDTNGLSLEYCCMVRNLTEDDVRMQERFTIPRGALELNNALSAKAPAAPSARGKRKA